MREIRCDVCGRTKRRGHRMKECKVELRVSDFGCSNTCLSVLCCSSLCAYLAVRSINIGLREVKKPEKEDPRYLFEHLRKNMPDYSIVLAQYVKELWYYNNTTIRCGLCRFYIEGECYKNPPKLIVEHTKTEKVPGFHVPLGHLTRHEHSIRPKVKPEENGCCHFDFRNPLKMLSWEELNNICDSVDFGVEVLPQLIDDYTFHNFLCFKSVDSTPETIMNEYDVTKHLRIKLEYDRWDGLYYTFITQM